MSGGDVLRGLQDADAHLAHVRDQLRGTADALQHDPSLERARVAAAEADDDRVRGERAALAAEATYKDLERRARALDTRLYSGSVHNPHELMEMQRELDTLREQLQDAEATALAAMENADAVRAASSSAAAAFASEQARRDAALGPLREQHRALEAALEEATRRRADTASAVAPRDLALYERVAARHHPAVVALDGDACGGCHLPLSIEERRAVRTGTGVVQCSGCDRILVT
jgi:predicted  nucleic acid-binding Zn-ribbon protein